MSDNPGQAAADLRRYTLMFECPWCLAPVGEDCLLSGRRNRMVPAEVPDAHMTRYRLGRAHWERVEALRR